MGDKTLKDKAIIFKGKAYVQVKDRVNYFNENYPNGSIDTELTIEGDMMIVKATVRPEVSASERSFSGYSQASYEDATSFVNKTSAIENAETSAVGRALAFMGIGVIDSIASKDEINKASLYQKENSNAPRGITAPQNGQPNVILATQKQLDLIKKLGGEVFEGMSIKQASDLISELQN